MQTSLLPRETMRIIQAGNSNMAVEKYEMAAEIASMVIAQKFPNSNFSLADGLQDSDSYLIRGSLQPEPKTIYGGRCGVFVRKSDGAVWDAGSGEAGSIVSKMTAAPLSPSIPYIPPDD